MKKLLSLVFATILLLPACRQQSVDPQEARWDQKADSVLKLMTLEEKIGQMVLYTSDWDVTGPTLRQGYLEDIRKGHCGNIFNAHTAAYTRKLQKIAVEESRLGIPLLFGYDVIHGHKTIFPISFYQGGKSQLKILFLPGR